MVLVAGPDGTGSPKHGTWGLYVGSCEVTIGKVRIPTAGFRIKELKNCTVCYSIGSSSLNSATEFFNVVMSA